MNSRDELSALASSASGKGPDSFNLFDRNPDYKNDYGWRLALDLTEYSPLKHPDNSILQSMRGPEFVAAFGVSEERLRRILDAQREAVILPSASVAPTEPMDPREEEEEGERGKEEVVMKIPKVIRSLGNDMIMGFA
ncbi:hypothetical protein K7X08_032141 [Anisodus acutangulus]|uniref:Uncharacterized protein n=1 Tax=Anisodus acutangulus TaxID=402998 RepID=A0A9Q1RMU0_9SOLA|nr:hypothetical protein K7X08_032141 [Anisodus acutangulus]